MITIINALFTAILIMTIILWFLFASQDAGREKACLLLMDGTTIGDFRILVCLANIRQLFSYQLAWGCGTIYLAYMTIIFCLWGIQSRRQRLREQKQAAEEYARRLKESKSKVLSLSSTLGGPKSSNGTSPTPSPARFPWTVDKSPVFAAMVKSPQSVRTLIDVRSPRPRQAMTIAQEIATSPTKWEMLTPPKRNNSDPGAVRPAKRKVTKSMIFPSRDAIWPLGSPASMPDASK
jgi:hypothetical protein